MEAQEIRRNGWKHGKRKRYYLDGSLAEEDEFIDGILYKNGTLANGNYVYLFNKDGSLRR